MKQVSANAWRSLTIYSAQVLHLSRTIAGHSHHRSYEILPRVIRLRG